jgi:hypothetical protein
MNIYYNSPSIKLHTCNILCMPPQSKSINRKHHVNIHFRTNILENFFPFSTKARKVGTETPSSKAPHPVATLTPNTPPTKQHPGSMLSTRNCPYLASAPAHTLLIMWRLAAATIKIYCFYEDRQVDILRLIISQHGSVS